MCCAASPAAPGLPAVTAGSGNASRATPFDVYDKPGDILRVGPFRFLVHYQLSDEAINHLIEILTISPTSPDESVDVELLDDAG